MSEIAVVARLGGAAVIALSLALAGPAGAQDASASFLPPVTAPSLAPSGPAAAQDAPAPFLQPAIAPALSEPQGMSEGVVATVNDEIISSYDVIQRMRLLIVTAGIQPNEQNLPDIQREALRSLVDEHLEMQELRSQSKTQKFDLIASKAEVDDELADIARSNNTSADQLLSQLAAQGVGPDTFRDQLRTEISWRGWIRGRYGSRLTIGEAQIKAYQARLAAEAGKPQYQISEVFVDATRAGGMEAAEQGAQQLVAELQKGAPFAAVARQFSSSPTAANGGEVGWVSPGEMPPEVDLALETLRPGQLSGPIPVRDGVYIIHLKERRAGDASTLITLKQAAIALTPNAPQPDVAAANEKLLALRSKLKGCDNLAAEAAKFDGVVSGDLGEAESQDLAPAFRQAAEGLAVGEVSQPIRTQAGLHLLAVCAKRQGGAQMLTHDQIADRLYGEQLSMIAKRYLRDLRNSATVEVR